MDGFYAYTIGSDGQIIHRVDLAYEKQEDAEKHARDSRWWARRWVVATEPEVSDVHS